MGTFLEYFDLYLYIHFATVLNTLFFSQGDSKSAALLTSFSYATSFLFRPIGAIVLGHIGDKYGRKKVINITFLLMGVSCLGIYYLPTYDDIGVWASVMITFYRAIQGISSMGEITGGEIYLTEYLKDKKIFIGVATLMLMCCLSCIVALYGIKGAILEYYDWRYLFIVGLSIFFLAYFARRTLVETPDYVRCKVQNLSTKVPFKTYVAFLFIEILQPIAQFISIVGVNNILREKFGYTELDIIIRNTSTSYCYMAYLFLAILLFNKFNPYKIAKVRIFVGILTLLLSPIIIESGNLEALIVFHSLVSFLLISDVSVTALKIKAIPTVIRFKFYGIFFAMTRGVVALLSVFGLVLLKPYLGDYTILVFGLPCAIGFLFAIEYFVKLDKAKGEDSLLRCYNN